MTLDQVATSFSSERGPRNTYHIQRVRAAPQSWGTSNAPFKPKKVGDINISFAEYSMSKSVHLTPDIAEYDPGASEPMYDLIIGKQSLHDIGAVLDFKDKTITIDSILLPMRNCSQLRVLSIVAGFEYLNLFWQMSKCDIGKK